MYSTWDIVLGLLIIGVIAVGLLVAILQIGRSKENKKYNNLYDGLDELNRDKLK